MIWVKIRLSDHFRLQKSTNPSHKPQSLWQGRNRQTPSFCRYDQMVDKWNFSTKKHHRHRPYFHGQKATASMVIIEIVTLSVLFTHVVPIKMLCFLLTLSIWPQTLYSRYYICYSTLNSKKWGWTLVLLCSFVFHISMTFLLFWPTQLAENVRCKGTTKYGKKGTSCPKTQSQRIVHALLGIKLSQTRKLGRIMEI